MHAIQENHTILKYIWYCKSENKQGVQIPHRWHMRLNVSLGHWRREATIGNLQPNSLPQSVGSESWWHRKNDLNEHHPEARVWHPGHC